MQLISQFGAKRNFMDSTKLKSAARFLLVSRVLVDELKSKFRKINLNISNLQNKCFRGPHLVEVPWKTK